LNSYFPNKSNAKHIHLADDSQQTKFAEDLYFDMGNKDDLDSNNKFNLKKLIVPS
jgi:hypothetical protein